jgi:hypothetical protein
MSRKTLNIRFNINWFNRYRIVPSVETMFGEALIGAPQGRKRSQNRRFAFTILNGTAKQGGGL